MFNKLDKVIHNLSSKLFFTISTIIQFALAFALIYGSLQLYISYNESNQKIINSLGNKTLYSILNNEDYNDKLYKKVDITDYNNFYKYITNNYEIITSTEDNFFSQNFKGIEEFLLPNTVTFSEEEETFYTLNSLRVNNNYFNSFNIKLSSGRFFTEEEYISPNINSEIPLILGSDYTKYLNLNDKITFYDFYNKSKRVGKIVGFLDKDQFYINRPVATENIITLNKTILIPNQPIIEDNLDKSNIKHVQFANIKIYQDLTSLFLININDSDINTIKQKSTELNFFDINISNLDESINIFKDTFKQQQILYFSIFTLILLITSIGLITNILNSINDRKREFGIYFALGATKKYIVDLVLYEILILIFTGAIFSLLIIKYIVPLINAVYFDLKVYLFMWLIVILVSILISLIPILKIKKTPMSELLREE